MRLLAVRTAVYVAVCALPAVAQPTLMSEEMSHVEVSVGAGAMEAGPGRDLEATMNELGLHSRFQRTEYPITSPPNVVPGVFAQANAALSQHTMLGVFLGADETTTTGRSPQGGTANVRADVKTRAVLASFRPTPWIKVAVGPALMLRRITFESDGPEFRDSALGWLTAADAKFLRRPMTEQRPPAFGYLTVQYRDARSLDVGATALPVSDPTRRLLPWPAQRVRMSHWMVGLGFGFEI